MQFIRRSPDERDPNNSVDDAHVVVQIGTAKTGLKAAHLVGTNICISRCPEFTVLKQSHKVPRAIINTEEYRALEALSQMQNALSPDRVEEERWPYSPDDAYPYRPQPNSTTDSKALSCLHREPSDATPPAYYDPGQDPYYNSQQTSVSASRNNMAPGKGAYTIFDNILEPPTPQDFFDAPEVVEDSPLHENEVRRWSTTRTEPTKTSSRALHLVNLLPHPRSTSARFISGPRISRSPSAMADYSRPPSSDRKLRKSRTFAGSHGAARSSTSTGRPFDEAVLDQHKSNVRRPPKGIQNWFDAYPDEDDDDDDMFDEVDEIEPQELPATDLPPAYTGPYRHMPRASDKSMYGQVKTHDIHHTSKLPTERTMEHGRLTQTSRPRTSSRSSSMQSSHVGSERNADHNRKLASNVGRERSMSAASGYEDEYGALEEEEEDYESGDGDEDDTKAGRPRSKLPAIRDSIFDDRNIMVANASALGVVRVTKPKQLNGPRVRQVTSSQSSNRSSSPAPSTQRRDRPIPLSPHRETHQSRHAASESATLRRLDVLSLQSESTTETNETSNTAETGSSGTSFDDTANCPPPPDALHMVAITEEERLLLELMRSRRVAVQQSSFTEGYQSALRSQQQRLLQHSAEAEERALRHTMARESVEMHSTSEMSASDQTPTQDSEMRRQLSVIRKEQVDERFQMERFLDMPEPAPLASHPPDVRCQEVCKPGPSAEKELQSPSRSRPSKPAPATKNKDEPGTFSTDDYDAESVRKRVKQFISTNGAPPPPDSNIKTMRRPLPQRTTNVLPSPVIEEGRSDAPTVPHRSAQRNTSYRREFSNSIGSTSNHRRAPSSVYDGSKDGSPVSAMSEKHSASQSISPVLTPRDQVPRHHDITLPPRSDKPVQIQRERKLRASPSQPQLRPHHQQPPPPQISINETSPFAEIISAASKVNIQHHHHHQSPPPPTSHISSQQQQHNRRRTASSTDLRASAQEGVQEVNIVKNSSSSSSVASGPSKQPSLPRLDTMEHLRDTRASLVSITSAGEEVLSAWAELGGGQDCLRTKIRSSRAP